MPEKKNCRNISTNFFEPYPIKKTPNKKIKTKRYNTLHTLVAGFFNVIS